MLKKILIILPLLCVLSFSANAAPKVVKVSYGVSELQNDKITLKNTSDYFLSCKVRRSNGAWKEIHLQPGQEISSFVINKAEKSWSCEKVI